MKLYIDNEGGEMLPNSALGGMVSVTIFGVVIVPGLYYACGMLAEGRTHIAGEETSAAEEMTQHV